MTKKITVYTTDYCPFCHAAKQLLTTKGVEFTEVNVEDDDVKRRWLFERTGQRTVPQIFVEDKSYGGFEDIQDLDQKGELNKILGLE